MKIRCPKCQNTLNVPAGAAGKKARCKRCDAKFVIPGEAAAKLHAPASPPAAGKSAVPPPVQAHDPVLPPVATAPQTQAPTAPADAGNFGEDLPDFLVVENAPAAGSAFEALNDNPFEDLPDSSQFAAKAKAQAAPASAAQTAQPSNKVYTDEVDFGAISGMESMIDDAVKKTQAKKKPKCSVAEIKQAFRGKFESTGRTPSYDSRGLMVALAMACVPLVFCLGVVLASIKVVSVVYGMLAGEGATYMPPLIGLLIFLVGGLVLLALWIPVLHMGFAIFGFLLSGSTSRPEARALTRESQPVLYEYVDQICERVEAPKPSRIDLDCDFNASAAFRRGWLSFGKDDLVLTLGVPLIAALNSEQLASVIAHEFGHFRQRRGMRATFLILGLVNWFIVAAHMDEEEEERHFSDPDADDVGAAVIDGIFTISRWVMLGMAYTGHAIGSALSRDMEYDADRYAIRLAGSKAFMHGMNRVERFGVAHSIAIMNLQMLFFRGVCIDNIPRFMMHIAKTMPATKVQEIAKDMEARRQRLMDSHPPTVERIKVAKELSEPGIVQLPRPAMDLVDHWVGLCENITLDFYCEVTGQKITKEHVNKLEDVLRDEHKLLLDKA